MITTILTMLLLAVSLLALTVASIWFLVVAFRVHVLWGLALLFFPVLGLVFIILHWDEVQKPFLLNMIGTFLMIVFFFLIWPKGGWQLQEDGDVELPSFSLSEKMTEMKQAATERKARETVINRGFIGRRLADVEEELGPPQAMIASDSLIEYQYVDRGLTLISTNRLTVTDEIRR